MPSVRHLRTVSTVCFWAYGLVLLIATHAPADDVQFLVRAADQGLLDADKILHIAAYTVLGLLAALAYGGRWRTTATAAVVLFAMLAAWGVVDELTQPLFGRLADASDWVCDMVGVAIGLAAGFAADRWLTARLRSAG
jgi:VanZ family protein